jgi:transcriptional regulator with XRE-family HTH domain
MDDNIKIRQPKDSMTHKPGEPGSKLAATFALRLRRWRQSQGVPIKGLAADLAVSTSVVSAWETGKRFPSALHLEALARHTGMSVCQLLYAEISDCPHCRKR